MYSLKVCQWKIQLSLFRIFQNSSQEGFNKWTTAKYLFSIIIRFQSKHLNWIELFVCNFSEVIYCNSCFKKVQCCTKCLSVDFFIGDNLVFPPFPLFVSLTPCCWPELRPAEPANKRTAETRAEDRFPAHSGGARVRLLPRHQVWCRTNWLQKVHMCFCV